MHFLQITSYYVIGQYVIGGVEIGQSVIGQLDKPISN